MKELEKNNVLDNEFLNLLDEQDSTLANDYILGATDGIGEEVGDDTCEKDECEKDKRACVGDGCNAHVCDSDGCSNTKASTDTCDLDVPTYFGYLVKFNSATRGSEKNEDTQSIYYQSYQLLWNPTNIMAANVSATHASNTTFVNAVKNNIVTLITGTSYSQFTGRTSSAMTIYNPNGQYSATPFCYVNNVRLAYNGHITKTISVPCYMKTTSSTGTPSIPSTFQAPITTTYLKANDYRIIVRDGKYKNAYLDGAEVYFNNKDYFKIHSGLTYLLTGKDGIVSVSTSANVSYLTGYVKKLSFNNNQPVYFTAYPNSDTEILLDNEMEVNQVANKADFLRMYPAITQYLTGISHTGRCFTTAQLNASGITVINNNINIDAILNRRAFREVDPGFNYLFNDATLGIGNPNFDTVSSAITATTTVTQFAVLPSTPQLGIHEFCLYYLATGVTSQTGTVTFTLYGRGGTYSWYELYSGSTTRNSTKNYISIPFWYNKISGLNPGTNGTFAMTLGIKVNSTISTMPRIVIPRQVIMVRTNDFNSSIQGEET